MPIVEEFSVADFAGMHLCLCFLFFCIFVSLFHYFLFLRFFVYLLDLGPDYIR